MRSNLEVTPPEEIAAETLRTARGMAGLNQTESARRAGVAQATVSAYENSRRQPTLPTLCRLVAAAGFELRLEVS